MHDAQWGHRPGDTEGYWERLSLSCSPSHSSTSAIHKIPNLRSRRSPLLPSGPFCDPGKLTSNLEGLVVAARDRPRDIFTASGGTKETDTCMFTLKDCKRWVEITFLGNKEV